MSQQIFSVRKYSEKVSTFSSVQEATTAQAVMLNAIKVVAYTASFSGVSAMPDSLIDFIINWEVESYRSKVCLGKYIHRNKVAEQALPPSFFKKSGGSFQKKLDKERGWEYNLKEVSSC